MLLVLMMLSVLTIPTNSLAMPGSIHTDHLDKMADVP